MARVRCWMFVFIHVRRQGNLGKISKVREERKYRGRSESGWIQVEPLTADGCQRHPASEVQIGWWEGTPPAEVHQPICHGESSCLHHQGKSRWDALVTILLTRASLCLWSAYLCLGRRTVKIPVAAQETPWGWHTAVCRQPAAVPSGCQ